MMPFDNNVTVLKMTGAELEQMVRNSVEGKSHSGMEVSGMTIELRPGAQDSATLKNFSDAKRLYRR